MEEFKPTKRQIEVVQAAANGKKQSEIALLTGLTKRGVESTIHKIRQAVPLKSLPAICVHFYKNGWIK